MGDQATSNHIKHMKRSCKCNIYKQIERKITLKIVDCQVPNKWDLASHYHGDITIARRKYLVKGER